VAVLRHLTAGLLGVAVAACEVPGSRAPSLPVQAPGRAPVQEPAAPEGDAPHIGGGPLAGPGPTTSVDAVLSHLFADLTDPLVGGPPPGEGDGRRGAVVAFDGRAVLGVPGHRGWDWALPEGTPVSALRDGVVRHAGVVPPFWCAPLGRSVDDQVAVVVAHRAPDGGRWETALHHLSGVVVAAGDAVRAGDVVGWAGATGCARGAHLHLDVFGLGEARAALRPGDPFGGLGVGPEPRGEPGPWLWAPGAAPARLGVWRREGLPAGASPLVVEALRYQGPHDTRATADELVVLGVDARLAPAGLDPAGWTVEAPSGRARTLPPGLWLLPGEILVLRSGAGPARGRELFWGSGPVWPDEGGAVVLRDPTGRARLRHAYGLGPQEPPPTPPAPAACPADLAGCVALPVGGPLTGLQWSPDGRWLALVVGSAPFAHVVLVPVGEDGAAGAPVRVAAPAELEPRAVAWVQDDLLAVLAQPPEGPAALWLGVPGLALQPAFSGAAALPGPVLAVAGGGGRWAALVAGPDGRVDAMGWRVGEPSPTALAPERRPETAVAVTPEGLALWASGGTVLAEPGAPTAGYVGEASALAVLGDGVVAVTGPEVTLHRPGAPPQALGPGRIVAAPDATRVARVHNQGAEVLDARGRRLHALAGALDAAPAPGGGPVAWVVPDATDAAAALLVVRAGG
jgi:murein DD-endopeptidase MepM/ murein hydrolase activator NlpD